MQSRYWLVKQEPSAYSWTDLVKEGGTAWTGVRNFQARNNLKAMQPADKVLFYHSGDEKAVVGVAKVTKAAYPDPTADEGDWVCVDLSPVQPLKTPVPLTQIRETKRLAKMPLLKQSRLSVMPIAENEFDEILRLGNKTAVSVTSSR